MARILSGGVLIAIAVLGVIYAPCTHFMIGIGLIGTACLHEYFGLARAMGLRVQPWFAYPAFWILLLDFRMGFLPVPAVIGSLLMAGFLSVLWRRQQVRDRAFALMAEVFGVAYFVSLLYPAIPIRCDFGDPGGMHWTLLLLIVIWSGDTAAFVVGKAFGRTPFAPVLSPRKTWEGSVGGLLAGIGTAVAARHIFFQDLPAFHVIAVSVVLGILGQLGDLAESLLKRAAEAKDSSNLIPGHGGVLDRMDSLLFAFPALYLYLCLFCR